MKLSSGLVVITDALFHFLGFFDQTSILQFDLEPCMFFSQLVDFELKIWRVFHNSVEFVVVDSEFFALGNEDIVLVDDLLVLSLDGCFLDLDSCEKILKLGSTFGVVITEVHLGVSTTDKAL